MHTSQVSFPVDSLQKVLEFASVSIKVADGPEELGVQVIDEDGDPISDDETVVEVDSRQGSPSHSRRNSVDLFSPATAFGIPWHHVVVGA